MRLLRRVDTVDTGLFVDQPGQKAPVWLDGQNVTFIDGYVRPAFGAVLINDTGTGVPISGFGVVRRSGAVTGYVGAGAKIFKFTDPAGTLTEVGSGLSAVGEPWVFQPWGNWIVATNNVDPPKIDKGAGIVNLDVDSQFTRCKFFVERTPYMFAANTDTSSGQGNDIWWCTQDDVETWLAVSTNLAGDTEVRNTISELMCGLKLGDQVLIYTQDNVYSLDFVGPPFVFALRKLPPDVGAVGVHSVCAVSNMHYGFGPLGIWQTDGISSRYLDIGAVRDYVYGSFNTSYKHLVTVEHLRQETSIAFSYPSAGSTYNDRTVYYNYVKNTWSKAGFGIAAFLSASTFGYDIMGWYTGTISRFGDQTSSMEVPTFGWGGTPVNSTYPTGYGWGEGGWGGYDTSSDEGLAELTTKPIACGSVLEEAYLDSIVLELDGTPSSGTLVYVGTQDQLADTITWDAGQAVPVGNLPIVIGLTARYFSVRLVDPSPATKWKLSAINFYGRYAGMRLR